MSDSTDTLVRMANQIARNLAHDHDPVGATLNHIRDFWDPRMKERIVSVLDLPLDPVAAAAVERLRQG